MTGTNAIVWTSSNSYVQVPGMSRMVLVPTGKHADFIVDYTADLRTCGIMLVALYVDGTFQQQSQMIAGGNAAETRTARFYALGFAPGYHTLQIKWEGVNTCHYQYAFARRMVVSANVY